MIFVVAFDRSAGTVVAFKEFTESARAEAESMYRVRLADAMFQANQFIEVNMFESENLETLQKTHSRYFQTIKQTLESLRHPA